MYLHVGKDIVVNEKSIIGIFDLDNTTSAVDTRNFLAQAEKSGNVINVSEELPKSFVLCCENDRIKVFVSQMASATLLKRAETSSFE
jgi:extracellular matrix regulatory protein B